MYRDALEEKHYDRPSESPLRKGIKSDTGHCMRYYVGTLGKV